MTSKRNYAGRARMVILRNLYAIRSSSWGVVLSGFFEPVFYLMSFGLGLGGMVGTVTGPGGQPVPYAAFLAPALLATSAMNGALYDSTWNVFFKLKFAKLYDGMVATSLGTFDIALGEIGYALLRGLVYSVGFFTVMVCLGLVRSPWGILAIPAASLIAFAFAAFGMAVTSYMKSFQEMDWINFLLLPMFLFSATFYPITVYPPAIQTVVQCLPLWHGVELIRGLTLGQPTWAMAGHAAYFGTMVVLGLSFTTRRLTALFLH
ncbi:MAG TPA: ABC transporter permease [Spirochaetia bacterium]|jgi:lipooligosaccharide transport system permease protein|nr:ABC transporter permease [Spirochaetia bacterium]